MQKYNVNIDLPFDSGISRGRNAIINYVKSKDLVNVDDDMLFFRFCCVSRGSHTYDKLSAQKTA